MAKKQLKRGESYDEQFFEELLLENGDYACFNRSLGVLEKSMKSEKMLRDFLREKKYPKSCINSAIEKLKNYGYIDDEAFCENYIASYRDSKSRNKLKYDLLSKGVADSIIDRKMEEILNDEDEEEKCLKFAQKFAKNRQFDLKTKQKLYNHLASKGFDYNLISKVWEKIQDDRD